MKKKKRTHLVFAVVAGCLLPVVPVYANAESGYIISAQPEIPADVNYVVDFVDWDGSILDSRICTYGEKLDHIVLPGQREDGGRIYKFIGWDPELSETVTGCMSYCAMYQRIEDPDDGGSAETVSGPEIEETPEVLVKTTSDSPLSGEIQQVSSTSYDVTSFHIGSDDKKTEVPGEQADVPVEELSGIFPAETKVPEVTDNEEVKQIPKTDKAIQPEKVENPRSPVPGSVGRTEPLEVSVFTETPAPDPSQAAPVIAVEDGRSAPKPGTGEGDGEREVSVARSDPKPFADSTAEADVEKPVQMSQKSFPLPCLLSVIPVCAAAAWGRKRIKARK